jgi:hypothetical protein
MQTNSEEMRAWLLGQFSVPLDGTVVTPTLAAESRAGRFPARLRRHASGTRLPSVRQAGRLTREIPRADGISPGNGMVGSHGGCKLFAPTPCST